MSFEPDELDAIHAEFAEPITYTGAGLTAEPITAIPSETDAGTFLGPGKTAKRMTFEIRIVDLPGRPRKGDRIVHETGNWTVIEPDRHRSIDAWILTVEESAP